MYKNICTFNFFLIKLVLVLEGDEFTMPNMKDAIKKVKQTHAQYAIIREKKEKYKANALIFE